MNPRWQRRALIATALSAFGMAALHGSPTRSARYDKAPEFQSQDAKDWIGAPQSMKALSGKVVLLDVWTFG